jgi:hypothetical protein
LKFTYNIQKIDFFIDQVEEKGSVFLEEAIEAFINFPFSEQLKDSEKYEMTMCLPTISFKSNDGKTLGIWAENGDGFFLHYDNGSHISDFFISNDITVNKSGIDVVEFIESFFNETIEKSLNLVEKKELKSNESKTITFSFNDTKKYKHLFFTFVFFLIALSTLIYDIRNDFRIGFYIHLLFTIFWLPGLIIHISYWLKNKNVKVIINQSEKTIEYIKGNQRIKFNRNEIHLCEINEARSVSAPWNSYRYLWIVLNNQKNIVITNFITEPELIIDSLKLNYKTDKRTAPFLPI